MLTVRFKIPGYEDREKLVTALANSGYYVKVVEERIPNKVSREFYVDVCYPTESEEK